MITATPRKLAAEVPITLLGDLHWRKGLLLPVSRSSSPTKSSVSRDRLVVRTLRCGRSNPGSNPGHGMPEQFFFLSQETSKRFVGSTGI